MALDFVPGMGISASGLHAERKRMDVAANNMANANSTSGSREEVYQRRQVVLSPEFERHFGTSLEKLKGVRVEKVSRENRAPKQEYAPHHPQANEEGMVQKANISPLEEMTDMMTAMRAYEANLNAMKQSQEMARRVIDLAK